MRFLNLLYVPHLLLLLLAFIFLSATNPTLDAANVHINSFQGRPRLTPSPLTRVLTQDVPKRPTVARDLYEMPNGWVRTF